MKEFDSILLDELVESLGAGRWSCSGASLTCEFDSACLELMDSSLSPALSLELPRFFASLCAKEDISKVTQAFAHALDKQTTLKVDFRRIACSNKEFARLIAVPDNDQNTHKGGLRGICYALDSASSEIQEQKRLFEELVNIVPVMINSFDASGQCLLWNKSCENTLGCSFEDAQQASDLMACFYPDPEIRHKVISAIASPDGVFREYPVVVKNGERRRQKWSNFRLSDGSMIGCGVDITESKEIQRKLNHEKLRFRSVIDNMPMGYQLWELNSEGRLLLKGYNHATESLLQVDHKSLIGLALEECFSEYEGTDIAEKCRDIALVGGSFEEEYVHLQKDGSRVVISANYFQCFPGAVIKMFWDVSALKLNELELQKARNEAVELERVKSQFLANMSHEIRTPMNGIIGLNEMLLSSKLDAEQTEWAQGVQTSSESLMNIINDILDLSKLESGKVEIERINFNLCNLLSEINLSLNYLAANKGLALKVENNTASECYVGDPTRIKQVLSNFISNAIKFTEEGSVSVAVSSQNAALTGIDRLRFEVCDSGIGMTEQESKQVFERFSQADISTTRRYGGTGLGLSICRQLVELMKGTIGVSSCPGKGSKFWFELDLDKIEERESSGCLDDRPVVEQSDQFSNLSVLVVEDNHVNQMVAKHNFGMIGILPEFAENGRVAIEKIDAQNFDFVFMDCHMPEMDGFEATRRLRSNENHKDLPIIALTAGALEADNDECLESGMSLVVTKPFKPEDLTRAIRAFLPL